MRHGRNGTEDEGAYLVRCVSRSCCRRRRWISNGARGFQDQDFIGVGQRIGSSVGRGMVRELTHQVGGRFRPLGG